MTGSEDTLLTARADVSAGPAQLPGPRPGRFVRATILLGWLAISVGGAALAVVLFAAQRLAWSLSECLSPGQCPPRGDPPGPEFLIVGAVIAVPSLVLVFLVGLAPTRRRTYTVSLGAAMLLMVALVAIRTQPGNLVPLPELLAAFVEHPLEAAAYLLGHMPDLVLVLVVALASGAARRSGGTSPTAA